MTKKHSPADAARANNSQSSTGPRSESGKARSSRNALKHGLRAETIALPGEDPAELQDQHDQWVLRFRPRDIIEYALVRMIFRSTLQMDRCDRQQQATCAKQIRSCHTREEFRVEHEVHRAHERLKTDPVGARLDLRRSALGCGFLISQWTLIRAVLERDGYFEQADLEIARRIGGVLAQGGALVGPATHPERAQALAAAQAEIRENLAELAAREKDLREWEVEPNRAEGPERALMDEDVARGSLNLRYLNAANSTFFRAVDKLLKLQAGRPDADDSGAACYGAPNEPGRPDPEPQAPEESEACAEEKVAEPGSSGGSWGAPGTTSYWTNESAESLDERLSIYAPVKSSQVAQGDAGRIGDR